MKQTANEDVTDSDISQLEELIDVSVEDNALLDFFMYNISRYYTALLPACITMARYVNSAP